MVKPESFLSAPIPGQSLTDNPKNYAWERPPQVVDYQEATKLYINRLANQDVMDDLAVVFDGGLPISAFVETITTLGVTEGLHNIDVKLIISPVIHAFIKAAMLEYGIDAKDDVYDPKKDPDQREKARLQAAIDLALTQARDEDRTAETDPGVSLLQRVGDTLQGDTPAEEPQEEPLAEEPTDMPVEPRRGLMARGDM